MALGSQRQFHIVFVLIHVGIKKDGIAKIKMHA